MSLYENDYSDRIEDLSKNLVEYMQKNHIQDPRGLIDYLLEAPEGYFPTIQSINARFHRVSGIFPLVREPALPTQFENDKLNYIVRVHLTAIKDGFAMYALKERQAIDIKPQVVEHVHYHHTHYDNSWGSNSFLRDLIIWDWILNRHDHHSGGHHRHDRDNDEGKMGFFAVVLLIAMAGSAAVAALYTTVQTIRSFDEMAHGEHTWENIAKLGAVGTAATAGVFIGMLIGASAFAMPAVGAILTAIIFAGVGYKAANMIHEAAQKSENNFSMIDGDSRFRLTEREWGHLASQGLNPFVVNEALRELALEMKHTEANSLLFLSKASKNRAEIISTMRLLKSGRIQDKTIMVGRKMFQLVSQYQDNDLPIEERYEPKPQFNPSDVNRNINIERPDLYTQQQANYNQPYSDFNNPIDNAPNYDSFFRPASAPPMDEPEAPLYQQSAQTY